MKAATCWGRSNSCCGGDGRGELSGGTLFTSRCRWWWMKAVDGGGGRGCWWRSVADDSVDGDEWRQRAASSPLDVGGGEAIVGGQWTMAG
jgi:hypothetical protein